MKAKTIVGVIIAFSFLIIIIFLINQTSQVVNLARAVNPNFGTVVLYGLLIVYAVVILAPIIMFLRMPAMLVAPDESSPEYPQYLVRLCKRLQNNPFIREKDLNPCDEAGIDRALELLNGVANQRIKSVATGVFISTSLSQYGKLDAVIVLVALSRIIWQVATVYNQRPSFREMAKLYINVGVTIIAVSEMENLKILESQLEPIFASIIGSSLATGANAVASIAINSVVQGSANAFLTIRVGAIAKGYCSSIRKPDRSAIRRSALVQATGLLGFVLGESVGKVTGAIYRSAKKATGKVIVGSGRFVVNRSLRTWQATKAGSSTAAATGKRMALAVAERVKHALWCLRLRSR